MTHVADKTRRWLLALTALVMAVSLAGPTAIASADAYNGGWTYLRFDPPANFPQTCKYRDISLTKGTYRWRVYTAHWAHPADKKTRTRHIHLRAGRYVWSDCIRGGAKEYAHTSWLSIGEGAARLSHVEDGRPYRDGSYNWASALFRTGP